jgi:hypothetical protein
MTVRGNTVTLLVVAGFVAYLLWSTLSSQHVTCDVTVAFGGGTNSATASAASETEAVRSAQTTACGPLAKGMNESIACSNIPPVSRRCRNS